MSFSGVSNEPPAAERVRAQAKALGFDVVAFARADVPLEEEMRRYEDFLAAGMHGEMRYLAEHAQVRQRLDTDEILPGARTVICLARRYPKGHPDQEEEESGLVRHIARYARGRDYHNFLRRKLRRLAAFVRAMPMEDGRAARARPMCDDVPVLERAWAARAGLGFIGKNGLLIVPGHGSYLLLGEVVTTLALPADHPVEGRCGECVLCLDACPTGAFPRPFVLDARRCVSYLTIELKGPVPSELRGGVGEHLFGCDVCQAVCPFNAASRLDDAPHAEPFEPAVSARATALADLLVPRRALAGVPDGSPLKRAGAEALARNAALVLGNVGDAAALPALEEAAGNHPSPMVREAAAWAAARIAARRR